MIERVERYHANWGIHTFLELEALEQSHVDIEIARAVELVTSLVRLRGELIAGSRNAAEFRQGVTIALFPQLLVCTVVSWRSRAL
jgi:hypothetical protein